MLKHGSPTMAPKYYQTPTILVLITSNNHSPRFNTYRTLIWKVHFWKLISINSHHQFYPENSTKKKNTLILGLENRRMKKWRKITWTFANTSWFLTVDWVLACILCAMMLNEIVAEPMLFKEKKIPNLFIMKLYWIFFYFHSIFSLGYMHSGQSILRIPSVWWICNQGISFIWNKIFEQNHILIHSFCL